MLFHVFFFPIYESTIYKTLKKEKQQIILSFTFHGETSKIQTWKMIETWWLSWSS